MHLILFNESFYFCPRDDLESLQLVRRSLLNIIEARSNVLALRPIERVAMGPLGTPDKIQIRVAGGADGPDYEASIDDDGDFAETVLRLHNTCIKSFTFGIRDSPFLRYWKAQEPPSFTVVSIDNFYWLEPTVENDIRDSIVNHLRPRTIRIISMTMPKIVELLARNSFLNNLQTCRLDVSDSCPPWAFFFNEPGYTIYELSCSRDKVADRTDGIIEGFVRDGCTNKKLESVYIHWTTGRNQQSTAPKQLKKPTKTDEPLPKTDMTAWLFSPDVHRVTQCEMQAFVNEKQRKRMDVYKWSVEYDNGAYPFTAYVLQCRMVNL